MTVSKHPSDFFTRLAERALGVAPLALPVIVPIYAPVNAPVYAPVNAPVYAPADPDVSGLAGTVALEWTEQSQVSADPGLSDAVSNQPGAVELPRLGVAAGSPRLEQPSQRLLAVTPVQSPGTGIPPVLQPVSPEPAPLPALLPLSAYLSNETLMPGGEARIGGNTILVEPQATEQALEPAGIDPHPARLLVPLVRASTEHLTVEQSETQGDPAGTDHLSAAFQARRISADGDRQPDTAAPHRSPRTPANLLARRASSPTAQPAWAEAERSGPWPEAIEQQPTIRITIGRVEVRAVQSPSSASARPAPRPAPSLSLDDYLKQRNEARR